MKTIVITGASDGIGRAAARQLSKNGHHVILVGRSSEKTRQIAEELMAPFHLADFNDLKQVRRLAGELLAAYPRIDVLANNAGGLFKRGTTKDGFEKTFQVNYLAEFLLTNLLLERLIQSKASVIQTSSIGAKAFGHIKLDSFPHSKKIPMLTYGDSKLANILFTKELHRRFHNQGLSAVAFHPGNIVSNFAHDYSLVQLIYKSPIGPMLLESPEDGGARLAWLAEGTPDKTWVSGEYYENNKLPPKWKIARQASDEKLAGDLWRLSERLTSLSVTDHPDESLTPSPATM